MPTAASPPPNVAVSFGVSSMALASNFGATSLGPNTVCDVEQQQAVCRDSGCGTEEECQVEEGIQDCYPKSFGVCTAVGATHYETFGERRFIF